MIQYTQLQNGIRIVTETFPHAKSVLLGACFNIGSRYENKNNNGISHLLEHMVFKGTKIRTATDILQELENLGGDLNALTTRRNTSFEACVLKENITEAIDLIADITQHPKIDKKDLIKEKEVILQEIYMGRDLMDEFIAKKLYETAYPDQTYGYTITGTPQTLRSITAQDVLDHKERYFTSNRLVISAAGAVDHDELVDLCQKRFTDLTYSPYTKPEPAIYIGGDYRKNQNNQQINLLLGFEGYPENHPDIYAEAIIMNLLCSNASSRLNNELREKRGLIYSIYSSSYSESDTGLLAIELATSEKHITEVMPILMDELVKVPETITEEEINRSKNILKADILMSSESFKCCMGKNAINLLSHGRIISYIELLNQLNATTKEQIQKTARKIFSSKPTLSAIGPLKKLMPYNEILSRLNYKEPIAEQRINPARIQMMNRAHVR